MKVNGATITKGTARQVISQMLIETSGNKLSSLEAVKENSFKAFDLCKEIAEEFKMSSIVRQLNFAELRMKKAKIPDDKLFLFLYNLALSIEGLSQYKHYK